MGLSDDFEPVRRQRLGFRGGSESPKFLKTSAKTWRARKLHVQECGEVILVLHNNREDLGVWETRITSQVGC